MYKYVINKINSKYFIKNSIEYLLGYLIIYNDSMNYKTVVLQNRASSLFLNGR